MRNNKMLTITTVFIITSIIITTLYYKNNLNKIIPIEDSYAYVNNSNVLNNNLEEIKSKIEGLDSEFNIDNYKISYSEAMDDESMKLVYLTYYIDDIIETNNVYIAKFENNKLEDVIFSGLKDESISEKELIRKVKEFDATKKEEAILKRTKLFKSNNILNRDKTINEKRLASEVNGFTEKYEYNYNSKELSYALTLYSSDTEVIRIKIN